jgi:4-diphosphocytidyl-2C-methyl-D-erythritol kinase
VGGTGERIDPRPALAGFAVGLVVPPIELSTPRVYRRWDRLGGPVGRRLPDTAVPPALRDEGIVNDLLPAAVAEAPDVGEWQRELAHRWERPVALAGSGPTLFACFVDRDEAAAAIEDVPAGVRDARDAVPVDHGWLLRFADTGTVVDSRGRTRPAETW